MEHIRWAGGVAGNLSYGLDVSYTAEGEWVGGCNSSMFSGGRFVFDGTIFTLELSLASVSVGMVVEANPDMEPVSAFYVKRAPFIRTAACDTTRLCTLIFYDAAVGYIQNIFTNWPRDNVPILFTSPSPQNGKSRRHWQPYLLSPAYQGPANPRPEASPYVWLVYQQNCHPLPPLPLPPNAN